MTRRPAISRLLKSASEAARAAGELMQRNLARPKRINDATQHDIKLELDVTCQRLITRRLRGAFPEAGVFGEEGTAGDPDSPWRWVVDPIDGTVNFTYGIPHACVSIALQSREGPDVSAVRKGSAYANGYVTRLGVVYDPFTRELWTASADSPARLNGRVIHVSERLRLAEAIVALGFAKHRRSIDGMVTVFQQLVHRVRKIRITGSAALSMTYVASGRFDAYVERGVRLWDIAAGGLLIERAGGSFWRRAIDSSETYEIIVCATPLLRTFQRVNSIVNP